MKYDVSETGIRRLAGDLFNCNTTKALNEAKTLVKRYRNGAGALEIMQAIREAKVRMGVPPKGKQKRLEGI